MYGKDTYGLIQYGQGDQEALNPDGHFVDLAQYAPPFLREVRELAQIWRTEGYEIGLLQYHIGDLLDQAFVVTATWGLAYWEEMYGIATNLALPYEQRREIILAKIRGQGTTTTAMVKQAAETFSGGEADIIEDNPNRTFVVRFVSVMGIPQNMVAFIAMLEQIKPAHLAYRFEYRYNVYGDLAPYSYGDLSQYTYEEITTLEGGG